MPVVSVRYNPNANKKAASALKPRPDSNKRARIMYGVLLSVCAVFIIKAFYLQIIKHDFYSKAALNYQLKEYQIPAERGIILAKNGNSTTPLVLNEIKYTLFADPVYVKDPEKQAVELSKIVGVSAEELTAKLKTEGTRYVVLAKKLNRNQHEAISKLDIAGVGTREQSYRTYPQGVLAAQTLGFVNDEGKGQYGVEQFLDEMLSGKPGELKAITDAKGVPLVSSPDNVITEPEKGQSVTLSIDIGIQQQLEDLLKSGLERAKSDHGSAVIMDPKTGKIVAMANYPSYDPNNISATSNLADFSNAAVTAPIEVGSVMKVLTAATALDQGVVSTSTAFYNKGYVEIGDRKITDTHNSEGTQTVESTLVESLNTGAVWLLEQIGRGGINERARLTWHDYMTKRFQLGKPTGVELAGEAGGYIPGPEDKGAGIDVIYANTSFGQGLSATSLQMAGALCSIVNGGTYYKPSVVHSVKNKDGRDIIKESEKVTENVINPELSASIVELMESVARQNIASATRKGYSVGGKTGTAEIASPEGGYYKDRFNGTYLGFVGGDKPEYVIAVSVIEPKIPGYAGSQAAAPIFSDIVNMLVDNFGVTPKS